MSNITDPLLSRRRVVALAALSMAVLPTWGCQNSQQSASDTQSDDNAANNNTDLPPRDDMKVHYLEVVTTDVEATCNLYSQLHGITFSEADANLGGARTAKLASEGTIGIRAPMHAGERPVTRTYVLVKDIEAAVKSASEAGGQVIVPPMKIPGHGQCAIFILGGIETGLWQTE